MQHAISPADGPIMATLSIPGSKYITHRALLISALATGVSELSGIATDDDSQSLVNALHQVGIVAQIDEDEATCIIAGGAGRFPKNQTNAWCTNSLLTTYFMLAGCAAATGVYYLDGTPELRNENIKNLLDILCLLGCQLIPNDAQHLPFTLIGPDTLSGSTIKLDHIDNNMITSALLMLAPYARSPITFSLMEMDHNPYINMTTSLMADFGVLVQKPSENEMVISAPQRYIAHDITVEPDYEIANYFFAAAAVTGGEMTINHLQYKLSRQPGLKFVSILEKMGCKINSHASGLTVSGPQQLKGIDVSLRYLSHSFLTLVAIAPFASSPTRISYSTSLSKKEVALLATITTLLVEMGIPVTSGNDWIEISTGNPRPIHIKTSNDPRIAMAFSVTGLKIPGMVIDDAECVIPVFRKFFDLWSELAKGRSIRT